MFGSAMAETTDCAQGLFVHFDFRAGRVQSDRTAVEARHGAAFERRQQGLLVGFDQVDQMLVERFAFGEGLALAHGGLRRGAVAPALGADAAYVRGRVVFHLLLHHGVHLAELFDGMRRAAVGAGRHGGDIARLQNEEARGGGPPSAWFDVSDYGNGRGDDFLDGVAHRIHQPARRVQVDDDKRGVLLLGARNGASDDLGGDGMHDPVHVHGDDLHGRGKGRCRYGQCDC